MDITQLLAFSVKNKASDLHLSAGLPPMIRVHGDVRRLNVDPLDHKQVFAMLYDIMNDTQRKVYEENLEVDFSFEIEGLARFRVNAFNQNRGAAGVLRTIPSKILTLEQLNAPKIFGELALKPRGLVLVTGPTGSGKTTTLYGSLHTLNTPDTKIITVEDPVEYQLTGINQVQINHDIGWDFARALRAIFRQDPDIVMVGEIRDQETAEIAIKAALTGHLVFSTLHTNDTASSFTRLIDIGIKPFLVASGVRAILAQRLVRTICNTCRETYVPAQVEKERLELDVNWDEVNLVHGAGCENCNKTGYQGRLGAYELLLTNDNLRTMIMQSESATALRRQARLDGMITMREDAWNKALQGITTVEEVNRRTRVDEPLIRPAESPRIIPHPAEEPKAAAGAER